MTRVAFDLFSAACKIAFNFRTAALKIWSYTNYEKQQKGQFVRISQKGPYMSKDGEDFNDYYS